MNCKEKVRRSRRAGFLYGLFRASPIPVEVLPKRLAEEAFDMLGLPIPKTLREMREELKEEQNIDALGFIPTRDKRGYQLVAQPYDSSMGRIERREEPGGGGGDDEEELVIEPELEIELEEPEIEVRVDQKMKERHRKKRLKRAQRQYREEQARLAEERARRPPENYGIFQNIAG